MVEARVGGGKLWSRRRSRLWPCKGVKVKGDGYDTNSGFGGGKQSEARTLDTAKSKPIDTRRPCLENTPNAAEYKQG